MKKMFILFLCIAGSAVASGRTGPAMRFQISTNSFQGEITADSVQRADPTTVQLRGSVQIVVGNAVITADEMDVRTVGPTDTAEIDLRGNVHITMKPSK